MSVIMTTGPLGGAPNRMEINNFVKHEKFFSLYVQALNIMQTKGTQDDPASFFQIGGIHGIPYVPWDGVTGQKSLDPNSNAAGYCNHGNVLFPTWHRPYVALFEQLVQQHAKEVAATYTVDCAAWLQAADELRQPYWDWATNSVPPDEVVALQQVTITGPHGHKITVDNPIYSYKFHPIDPSFPPTFQNRKSTIRYPTSDAADATVDVAKLKATLLSHQSTYTTNTYNMLTQVHTWPAFSNDTAGGDDTTANSLEAIHNIIHFGIGGPGGHMSDVSMAGFDPVFFLHHCNVDRMLSLWSALNAGVWVSQGDSKDGTIIIPPNSQIDQATALTPFRTGNDTFWASSGVEDTAKLGYTYPDFDGLDMNNPDAVFTAIGNLVNQKYGVSVSGDLPSPAPPTPAPAPPHGPGHHVPHHGQVRHAPPHHGFQDWTARIEFKKYEVGQSFSVLLFLGVPPEDPKQWNVCSNFAGTYVAFVNSMAEQCANCVNNAEVVVEGYVHLNNAIAKHSRLDSLDPEVVEPYLTKALHWRVQKVDGEPVDLRSLEVSVFSTPLSYPPGSMFPVAGARCRRGGITHGRPGGCRHL
ncbi:tyrosinase [Gymnopilus junonius]|uniref:tyrosinase n=1 Tax=Gymnopilus junonius TaxID=109634 RepID=A0A9P5NP12_GYMJU|nr:tyrosinase [Gymnopilus junonius]